jgi:AcrR family transcriptional regulator
MSVNHFGSASKIASMASPPEIPESPRSARQRVPAAERRDALIDAAIEEFAHTGLHGTPVDRIARRVGVAQPYVFSLFPTKRDLFIAAVERCFGRVQQIFERAAAEFNPATAEPEQTVLKAIGDSYVQLLGADRLVLMLQLQAYAACDDEVIRTHVHAAYSRLRQHIMELSGTDAATLDEFLAFGMYLSVQAAVSPEELPEIVARRKQMLSNGEPFSC